MMRAIVLFLLLFILTGWTNPSWEPPPQYVHTYHGKLTIYGLRLSNLRATCPNGAGHCWAWAAIGKGWCKIILPSDIDPEARAQAYRHELAHCNGWKH